MRERVTDREGGRERENEGEGEHVLHRELVVEAKREDRTITTATT